MKISESSARLIGQILRKVKGTQEDAVAVGLLLGTEENAQEFFAWFEGLDKPPTPQECFEEAVRIAGYLPLFEQQKKEVELERLSVNMSEDSKRLIREIMQSVKGTQSMTDHVERKLKTDENAQKFFTWFEGLDKPPTPQRCLEEALSIIGYFADEEEEEED